MLKVGDPLPEFEARTTEGCPIRTAALRGKPAVLFFFPKAFTPGCVRETKSFRDEYPSLARRGVRIVGVSTDPLDAQCRFAEWAGVPFPLVADTERCMSKLFGVLWPLVGVAKRVTFVADAESIIRHVFHHELRVDCHVRDVREAVEALGVSLSTSL
jgi:peroxiredoxin